MALDLKEAVIDFISQERDKINSLQLIVLAEILMFCGKICTFERENEGFGQFIAFYTLIEFAFRLPI